MLILLILLVNQILNKKEKPKQKSLASLFRKFKKNIIKQNHDRFYGSML